MFFPFDARKIFEFHVIGVSHRKTPLKIREQFSISNNKLKLLSDTAIEAGFDNLLTVSTCNRTELYSFTNQPEKLNELLIRFSNNIDEDLFTQHVYHKKNHEAVKHLFGVSAGIDSQILGDFEIVGQIKKSLQNAKENNLANSVLIRLVEQAIRCSKQIKKETEISIGTSSIASASVQFLQKNITNLDEKKVLLIGAGKIGRVTCSNLTKHIRGENITVVNRTLDRAKSITHEYALLPGTFDNLRNHIAENDIIIVSTGADHAVVNEDIFCDMATSEKVILDLSVPRNVDDRIGELPNVILVNIEQLEDIKNESLLQREQSIPKAKQIIHALMLEYYAWLHATPIFPLLQAISIKAQHSDLNKTVAYLNEAGIVFNTTSASSITIDAVVNKCITHLKENYHKPDVSAIMCEAFQLEYAS
jgi:glutamyl-tRNA reductase